MSKDNNEMIWANLLHLGFNMWLEEDAPRFAGAPPYFHLGMDEETYNDQKYGCCYSSWRSMVEGCVPSYRYGGEA